jgi:transposase
MSQHNPTTTILYVGCDVAKQTLALDPALLPKLPAVANDRPGHQQLLRALKALAQKTHQTPHLVVEATGGYEQALVRAAHAAGVAISVVMPRRVRAHATSLGQEAKTDRIDAGMLSSFGRSTQPPSTPPPTPTEARARALSRRRTQLVQLRAKERTRRQLEHDALITKSLDRVLRDLSSEIARIEAALKALRQSDPLFAAKVAALEKIDGVATITALNALATVPELGQIGRRSVANLVGLAPKARDSGTCKARRYISGGRPDARLALYMAAVTASRKNPILAPFYQRLRAAGKSVKLARIAVMRRLLCHMNSCVRAVLQSNHNATAVAAPIATDTAPQPKAPARSAPFKTQKLAKRVK